jgi:hypothetical protein
MTYPPGGQFVNNFGPYTPSGPFVPTDIGDVIDQLQTVVAQVGSLQSGQQIVSSQVGSLQSVQQAVASQVGILQTIQQASSAQLAVITPQIASINAIIGTLITVSTATSFSASVTLGKPISPAVAFTAVVTANEPAVSFTAVVAA